MGKLQKTAYHKAGHAVASVVLKRRFGKITVSPKGDDFCRISSLISSINENSKQYSKTRKKLEDEIIIYYGGVVAERLYSRGYNWNGERVENRIVGDTVEFMNASDDEVAATLDSLFIRARDLIKLPCHWCAVETLAYELLKQRTIGYHKARQIIFDALKGID
jgi:hypothetical protein